MCSKSKKGSKGCKGSMWKKVGYGLLGVGLFLWLGVGAVLQAQAAVPKLINYQGKLTDTGGKPVTDGNYNITFRLYTQLTGDPALWTETYSSLPVANGLFNVILGSVQSLNLDFSQQYYLGIQIGGDTGEMTPRQRLTSVGYAMSLGGVVNIVDANGNVSVGTNGTGYDVNFYGQESGSRLFWDKSKMAFRAGKVTETQWNDANVGLYSLATGFNTRATATCSTAMGESTVASGAYSTAMGRDTVASGVISTAMGVSTVASGGYSTAMGYNTKATATCSTAMGQSTVASGDNSTAMGYNTVASGDNSTAMGYNTVASGNYSTAMGREIKADGDYSVAIALNDQNGTVVSQNNTMAIMGGRIGIGTNSPRCILDVYGDKIQLYETSTRHSLAMRTDGDLLDFDAEGAGLWINAKPNNTISLNPSGYGNVLIANGGGNVGIGIADPQAKLHVNGKIKSQNAKAEVTSSSSIQTESREWVDMPGMQITVTTNNSLLYINFVNSDSQHTSSIYADYQLLLDGSPIGFARQFSNKENISILRMPTVSAGTHTIRVQWRVYDGRAHAGFASGTRTLVVIEF